MIQSIINIGGFVSGIIVIIVIISFVITLIGAIAYKDDDREE